MSFKLQFLSLIIALLLAVPVGAIKPYRIRAGDLLSLQLLDHPEYTHEERVNGSGRISPPGMPAITVAGMTVAEVAGEFENAWRTVVSNPVAGIDVIPRGAEPSRGSGDTLRTGSFMYVKTEGFPEFCFHRHVLPDGSVQVPLAGMVPAAGKRRNELAALIAAAYAAYINMPQVWVLPGNGMAPQSGREERLLRGLGDALERCTGHDPGCAGHPLFRQDSGFTGAPDILHGIASAAATSLSGDDACVEGKHRDIDAFMRTCLSIDIHNKGGAGPCPGVSTQFIRWVWCRVMRHPDRLLGTIPLRRLYASWFQLLVRNLVESYRLFHVEGAHAIARAASAYAAAAHTRGFHGPDYLDERFAGHPSSTTLAGTYNWAGFWLRRRLDGTDSLCAALLGSFLQMYDPAYHATAAQWLPVLPQPPHDTQDGRIAALRSLGQCSLEKGDATGAVRSLRKALDLEMRVSNPRLDNVVATALWAAAAEAEAEETGAARECEEIAAHATAQLGDRTVLVAPLLQLMSMYTSRSERDPMGLYAQRVMAVAGETGRRDAYAVAALAAGAAEYQRQRPDSAGVLFMEALAQPDSVLGVRERMLGLNALSTIDMEAGRLERAREHLLHLLGLARREGDRKTEVEAHNKLGMLYERWGRPDRAMACLDTALIVIGGLDWPARRADILNNIGMVYQCWGRYDQAIDHYTRAMDTYRDIGCDDQLPIFYSNIGSVYLDWHQYDKAIGYFERARDEARRSGKDDTLAILLNLSSVYRMSGRSELSIQYARSAVDLAAKRGMQDRLAAAYNQLGLTLHNAEQGDSAGFYYRKALGLHRSLGMVTDAAQELANLAMIHAEKLEWPEALALYREALAATRAAGMPGETGIILDNMARVLLNTGRLAEALQCLREALVIKERLRETAAGDARRDYLDQEILTYEFLTEAFIEAGRPDSALWAIEMGRAKLLAEQLSDSNAPLEPVGMQALQAGLGPGCALLAFSGAANRNTGLVVVTTDTVAGLLVRDSAVVARARSLRTAFSGVSAGRTRGFALDEGDAAPGPPGGTAKPGFEEVVRWYRDGLAHPSSGPETATAAFAGLLHELLIGPVEAFLQGCSVLVIVPDGILGYLPFETLRGGDGRFLVERYDISYAQSATVWRMVNGRKLPRRRRSVLAFGGARYEASLDDGDAADNERQLAWARRQARDAIRTRSPLGENYAALGLALWSDLPSTLEEAKRIAALARRGVAVTGAAVNEACVKRLSASGELAGYRILHFATHGLVVPELPELNALVLSQQRSDRESEDGYLRLEEIARLRIAADVVNLSACETGLGKIYGGEGVVGLSHAFLLAGANGLSVSLWQVADESTMEFMTAVYRVARPRATSFASAMTHIKRQFVRGEFGEQYRHPFYWAPFVYYGAR